MIDQKYTTVSLPKPLVEKIKKRMKRTGFKSVSDYVTFVLREVVADTSKKKTSRKDEKRVKARLKALGYLD